MFSTEESLRRRTGPLGTGRLKYLQALVTEYQDTNEKENKLQIIANLANFGYDPINYGFFRTLNVLDLFLDVLAEEEDGGNSSSGNSDYDDMMKQFAIGGICNCCLDRLNKAYVIENDGIHYAAKCLDSTNNHTVMSAITTLMYLITPETRLAITAGYIQSKMKQLAKSANPRISNLATIFLEDYCKRNVPTEDD